MNKLRLLFTDKCNRNCKKCCNKNYDLSKVETVDHFNYDEIIITGGEPLLFYKELIGYIACLRRVTNAPIYVYTAMTVHNRSIKEYYNVLEVVDGITLTLHEQDDVAKFSHVLYSMKYDNDVKKASENKSLRLNVFKGIDLTVLSDYIVELNKWQIKNDIEWLDDCPLSPGKVFKKI